MVFIKCLSLCSFAHASDEQISVSHENLEVLYFQNMLRFTALRLVLSRKLSISMRRKSFYERVHRLNPSHWMMRTLTKRLRIDIKTRGCLF